MTPEVKILILNAAVLAVAYAGIYPSLREKTLRRMMQCDVVLTIAVMVAAGALFAGSGIRFGLILFDANWFFFTLLTLMAMEAPLFLWFCKRHGIEIGGAP